MTTFSSDTIQVAPGGFVLARTDRSVIVIDDGTGRRDQTVTANLMAVAATADLAAIRTSLDDAAAVLPAAAALVQVGDAVHVLLLGPLTVIATSDVASLTLDTHGGLRRGVEEAIVPRAAHTLTIGPPGVPALTAGQGERPASASTRVGRILVSLQRRPAAVSPSRPPIAPSPGGPSPSPAVEPAAFAEPDRPAVAPLTPSPAPPVTPPAPPPEPAGAIADPAPATTAAPLTPTPAPESDASPDRTVHVFGVRCPRDHHNHPEAEYCTRCGLKMGVNQTAVVGLGPRPPLGLLLLDDGTSITIDDELVVGREPQFHELVTDHGLVPVPVADPDLNLSRAHFAVRLTEWNVAVADLGSSNGTFVCRDDTSTWIPVEAHTQVQVHAGDRIRAGSRELQVELHHIAD